MFSSNNLYNCLMKLELEAEVREPEGFGSQSTPDGMDETQRVADGVWRARRAGIQLSATPTSSRCRAQGHSQKQLLDCWLEARA